MLSGYPQNHWHVCVQVEYLRLSLIKDIQIQIKFFGKKFSSVDFDFFLILKVLCIIQGDLQQLNLKKLIVMCVFKFRNCSSAFFLPSKEQQQSLVPFENSMSSRLEVALRNSDQSLGNCFLNNSHLFEPILIRKNGERFITCS